MYKLKQKIQKDKKEKLLVALKKYQGQLTEVAKELQIPRTTVYRWIANFEIEDELLKSRFLCKFRDTKEIEPKNHK